MGCDIKIDTQIKETSVDHLVRVYGKQPKTLKELVDCRVTWRSNVMSPKDVMDVSIAGQANLIKDISTFFSVYIVDNKLTHAYGFLILITKLGLVVETNKLLNSQDKLNKMIATVDGWILQNYTLRPKVESHWIWIIIIGIVMFLAGMFLMFGILVILFMIWKRKYPKLNI